MVQPPLIRRHTSYPNVLSSITTSLDSTKLPSMDGAVPNVGHCVGQCRPCAWVDKPGGYRSGAECSFCHICTVRDKKNNQRAEREKKRNLKSVRAKKRHSI